MNTQRQLEREEDILEDELAEGRIDLKEYNSAMRELQREARAAEREELSHEGD